MEAKKLLNWGELSRMLSGSRQTVRKNKIPKIHQPFINDLLKAMNKVIDKQTNNINMKWTKASEAKPTRAYGMSSLSDKVEVKTKHGDGFGIYDYSEDNWIVELKSDNTDELQSYTGVVKWRYI